MKKHFTTGRILIYLLLLTGVGASLVGVSDARYSTVVRGGASATVAAVALDITGNRTSIDLSSHLQDMSPGSERNLVFSVSNQKNGAVSQVTQEYSITVGSTGNLPLTFHLAPQAQTSQGICVNEAGTSNGQNMVWTGGLLPCSKSAVTHTYTLTVRWPSAQSNAAYASEIDLVTLSVDAEQVMP